MEALSFGRWLDRLEEGTRGHRGDRLGALQFDKRSWGREAFLLLAARVKDFHLGNWQGGGRLGPVTHSLQAVVLLFGLVRIGEDFTGGHLAGQLFVTRTLCLFVLRGLAQSQGLFSQEIER